MIKALRKRHLQVWLVLALLLPIGIISAWLAVPAALYSKLFQPEQSEALPVVIKTITNNNRTINLRTDANHQSYQLEWANDASLTAPSSLIYQTTGNDDIKDATIVGRIDPRGTYHFALKNDTANKGFHFVVYDIIHHKVIEKINF